MAGASAYVCSGDNHKGWPVARITIEDLDPRLEQRLRERAAEHGCSIEDEVREILRTALPDRPEAPQNLGTAIHERFKALGGVDLELPAREPMREPPDFA